MLTKSQRRQSWSAKAARRAALLLSASALGALGAGPALAQQGVAPVVGAQSDKIETVEVTADRQGAKDVQQLPIAVSVVNPYTLDTLGLTGLSDYSRMVPSLSMQELGPGVNNIVIRGLSVRGLTPSEVEDRSLVAVYIDDMPISLKSATPDFKVLDLEDVEVLEGPQGTLYGAGAMAGTIRLTTKKPDSQDFSGSVENVFSGTTDYGGFNDSQRFVVNVPIIKDELAIRASGYFGDDSSYIKNIGPAGNGNPDTIWQGRGAIRWTPIPQLTIDASMTYDHTSAGLNNGYSFKYGDEFSDTKSAALYSSPTNPPVLGDYQTLTHLDQQSDDNLRLYNLTIGYDLGAAKLSSSTTFMHRDTLFLADDSYDIGCYPLSGPQTCGGAVDFNLPAAYYTIRNHIDDTTEEVRLTSSTPGPLKWTTGVFYEQNTRQFWENIPVTGFDALYAPLVGIPNYQSQVNDLAFGPNDVFSGTQNTSETQTAIYAQGTYTLWDKLDLTAGVRYFDESEKYNLYFSGLYGDLPGPASAAAPFSHAETTTSEESAKGINPKFGLAYHLEDDNLIWAEAAKGFRYGGNNQPVPFGLCGTDLEAIGLTSAPATFGPDSLWSYSIGDKASLFDGRATLDVTGFVIDWKNVQTFNRLTCSYYYTENAGSVQSKGVEVAYTMKLAPGLRLDVNGSYNDAETTGFIQNLNAPSGSETPYSPKYIANAILTYNIPVGDHNVNMTANYSYRGTTTTATAAPVGGCTTAQCVGVIDNYRQIPSSNDVNLSVSYQLDQWEFTLFGDNVTGGNKIEDIVPQSNYTAVPGDSVYYARPATFGLRVKYDF